MILYNPILFNINNKPVLCIIDKWIKGVLARWSHNAQNHINKIFEDRDIKEWKYYFVFLRNNEWILMTDLRCHDNIDEWISDWYWPILYPYIYENYTKTDKIWVASWLTINILSQIENERKNTKYKDYYDMLDNIFINEEYLLKDDF